MKRTLFAAAGLAGILIPWALTVLPLKARLSVVALLVTAGGIALVSLLPPSRRNGKRAVAGAWLVSVGAASLWIAVASYSAQISLLTPGVIYPAVMAAILSPALLLYAFPTRTVKTGGAGKWYALFLVPLALSVLLASPARRYEGGGASPEIRHLTESLEGPRQAMEWVHENIEREASPFTDRAVDTLRRGTAHCGGMSNLLDKILKAMKVESRIVHLESGGRIHTLVEYRAPDTGQWVLLDPQNDLSGDDWKGLSGLEAIGRPKGDRVPREWADYAELYVYVPGRGYRRVSLEGSDEYYGSPVKPAVR